MTVFGRIVLFVVVVSYLAAIICVLLEASDFAKKTAAPALIILGWSAFNHMITLDDDLPGGWSNPEGINRLWWESVGELVLKIVAFFTLVVILSL